MNSDSQPGATTGRRRVLFLTPQYPYPPEQGTALRNYGLVRGVAERHEVTLFSFADGPLPNPDPLAAKCQRVVTVPTPERTSRDRLHTLLTTRDADMAHRLHSEAAEAALRELVSANRFDIVQAEGIEMAPYALKIRDWLGADAPCLVFDDHNVEYLLQRRAGSADWHRPARWAAALYSYAQYRRLMALETRICRQAQAVLVVSEEDGVALRRLMPELNPFVIPNGLDVADYDGGEAKEADVALQRPAVVFTGKMDYRPNVDAMLWFYRRVWPTVRKTQPSAHLYVVGKSPHRRLHGLSEDDSVTVTGYVEDVLPYFRGADVYIAPFRVGGGTRLKILQALAASLPLVTTTVGAEGIAVVDGVHARVADDAATFARAVLSLAADREAARALGTAGRQLVANHYDWSAIIPQLEAIYRTL